MTRHITAEERRRKYEEWADSFEEYTLDDLIERAFDSDASWPRVLGAALASQVRIRRELQHRIEGLEK